MASPGSPYVPFWSRQVLATFYRDMRIRINRPELMHDLIAALCGGECSCEAVDEQTLSVTHRTAEDEREARIEVSFFLRAWASRYPAVSAELVA